MKVIGTKKWTGLILIGVTIGLIVWDFFMISTPQDGDTISEFILNISMNHPSIPFAFGCLMGHLFWSQKVKED